MTEDRDFAAALIRGECGHITSIVCEEGVFLCADHLLSFFASDEAKEMVGKINLGYVMAQLSGMADMALKSAGGASEH